MVRFMYVMNVCVCVWRGCELCREMKYMSNSSRCLGLVATGNSKNMLFFLLLPRSVLSACLGHMLRREQSCVYEFMEIYINLTVW